MAKAKTLYVKDEDQELWDEARGLAGVSLSAHLTNYLRRFVADKKAEKTSNTRIEVSFFENGLPKLKAFYGRWIIPPNNPFIDHDWDWQTEQEIDIGKRWALAISQKDNVVIFYFNEILKDGELRIFKSLDDALESGWMPKPFIAEAMSKIGVEVEELDI